MWRGFFLGGWWLGGGASLRVFVRLEAFFQVLSGVFGFVGEYSFLWCAACGQGSVGFMCFFRSVLKCPF